MTLAAYFQCYKSPYATVEVIRHFRKAYPDSTVYLLSDNGYDYSELAKEYNCIYEHSTIVHGGGFPTFKRHEDILLFLWRMKRAFDSMKEEWMIILEDDVKVFAALDESKFIATMNGTRDGNFMYKSEWMDEIRKQNPTVEDQPLYSGWGGTVLNVPFFKKALATDFYTPIHDLWVNKNARLYVTDLALSFVCFLNGGTTGPLAEHRENGDYNPTAKVVNFDKSWCKMPLEGDDVRLVKM